MTFRKCSLKETYSEANRLYFGIQDIAEIFFGRTLEPNLHLPLYAVITPVCSLFSESYCIVFPILTPPTPVHLISHSQGIDCTIFPILTV